MWRKIAADEPLTKRLTSDAINAARPPGSEASVRVGQRVALRLGVESVQRRPTEAGRRPTADGTDGPSALTRRSNLGLCA